MGMRDFFWRQVTAGVVRHDNVVQPHRAPVDEDYVRPIPIERRYPGLAGTALFVSENTPGSEVIDTFSRVALHEILAAKESLGLSEAYPEPFTGTGVPYPREYQALFPAPEVPPEFAPGADKLAGIAQRGSFSLYTKPDGAGGFQLDLSGIEGLEPHPPYVRTGGRARFARNADGSLSTTAIEFQGTTTRPGDPGWDLAVKRVLVALNTWTTFVDHLTHVHLCGAGTLALCTYLALPTNHPLRVLLQPFVVETMRVNNDNIDGLIRSEHSNVPSYSGYPLATLDAVMRDAAARFDLRWFDAEHRARQAGTLDDPTFPTVQSAVALYRHFRAFTSEWCEATLPSVDLETRIWVQELDARVPNGVKALLGVPDLDGALTVEHVAHLAATLMFAASVWHHIVANMPRDFEMQFDVMPPAIDAEGRTPLGVVYEKRNSITIASLLRYKLVDDTVYLPTDAMKRCWAAFQARLKDYEGSLDRAPGFERYRVVPSQVPSSVHA